MTRNARARRSAILCSHFLRNIAFYESWFNAGQPFKDDQFWITANGNFLDIAVLEWCKLFADRKAKHHFTKVLGSPDHFRTDLFAELHLGEVEWGAYIEKLKAYRDKFIAHLDDQNIMNIPDMNVARRSAIFLYQHLLDQEAGNATFHDARSSADAIYQDFLGQGFKAYEK
jgi:hypothetical protein